MQQDRILLNHIAEHVIQCHDVPSNCQVLGLEVHLQPWAALTHNYYYMMSDVEVVVDHSHIHQQPVEIDRWLKDCRLDRDQDVSM
jgi:hypothetical protein